MYHNDGFCFHYLIPGLNMQSRHATARKHYGGGQCSVNMHRLYIILHYTAGCNPVVNHSESYRLNNQYRVQLFYKSVMKLTSAAVSCFTIVLASFCRCQGQCAGREQRQEGTWRLSPVLFQHSEFYVVSQDFNCLHNKLYLFKMLVY